MASHRLYDTPHELAEPSDRPDVIFSALSNRRRRLAVSVLRGAEAPLDIGPLATRIAAHEHGIDSNAVTHRQRKSVYTALHQNHLPKLADAGFISAEREWVGIRLTDRADVLESHLEGEPLSQPQNLWPVALATGLCTTGTYAVFPGFTLPGIVAALTVTLLATLVCVVVD
jgi:hypothetical protein